MLIWKGIRIVETDMETKRRRERLEAQQSNHIDLFVWAGWIAAGLIVACWARILWLVGRDLITAMAMRFMR
jgi:hypothetical protein